MIFHRGFIFRYFDFFSSFKNKYLCSFTLCLSYAGQKFAPGAMTADRLDGLLAAKIVSHVLVFSDTDAKDVGIVFLYLHELELAFYYYAFYDLNYFKQSLGMYMMTAAVIELQKRSFKHVYLGSCYSKNALYKTQFQGAQFFTGFRWSDNLEELKFLLERDSGLVTQHLLENQGYLKEFYNSELGSIKSSFKLKNSYGNN